MTLEQMLVKLKNADYQITLETHDGHWHLVLAGVYENAVGEIEDHMFENMKEMKDWLEESLS